ncbi:hypothetical protein HNO89_003541 [Sporosarcina luteola]|nr:hypothetical protein [Sporosarcina luteola]
MKQILFFFASKHVGNSSIKHGEISNKVYVLFSNHLKYV